MIISSVFDVWMEGVRLDISKPLFSVDVENCGFNLFHLPEPGLRIKRNDLVKLDWRFLKDEKV